MATLVKRPMLSPPKQIPIQLLLFNVTSSHFFDSQIEKNLSKTITTKLYPVKECEERPKEQCIKNKPLYDTIYSIANL